ncbi:class II glutamine amidotransferase [Roseobacter sp. HKCCA0434]|uniref:class II glutamine amidotransferase n=1 Tax=Roseobacter sp. HKCCA0434 TaxID=3079297 RepID=UPI002905AEBA|nr:class II glutamine amidotransferase [Roseobacter sp. HKCCA0434]
MCRWAAWIGQPIYLEELLSAPANSLIHQSRHASEAKTDVNADGFGLAWYGARPWPGQYRDVHPAWSDPNLRAMAEQVASPLFLAHVRAGTGAPVSRENAHPFVLGRWCFMHNGQIGGFDAIRQKVDAAIRPDLYAARRGTTDSEALFLLAAAEGLETDPVAALLRAVDRLRAMGAGRIRMTVALADGTRLIGLRLSSDGKAPSLYIRSCARGTSLVSEPLETGDAGWRPVAEGEAVICSGRDLTRMVLAPQGQLA